ncbi:MAG: glycosyltransferase, partial [Cryomorphaceae bacterium]
MSARILHIVKWYPNPVDPQNGIFVKKHINATSEQPNVLGFINAQFETIEAGNLTLYGAQEMGISAKVAALYGALAKVQPDAVHFHCYAQDLWVFSKILKSKGIPYFHSEHWSGLLPENNANLRGIKRKMMKAFFEGAAQVLPVSPALSQGILQVAPKAKITVVPNIIDEIDFSKPKEFSTKSFCVIGDVVFSIKRQDIILKAFRQLPTSQCELHFYGGGPDLEELQALTKHDLNTTVHGRTTNEAVLHSLPNHHAHVQFSAYE